MCSKLRDADACPVMVLNRSMKAPLCHPWNPAYLCLSDLAARLTDLRTVRTAKLVIGLG